MQVNLKTVYDYYGFCRGVCYLIVTNNETVNGGKEKILQVDESHIYQKIPQRTCPKDQKIEVSDE